MEEKGARRQGEEDLEEKGLVQNQESRVGLSECSKQGTSLMFQVCLSCFGLGKYTLVISQLLVVNPKQLLLPVSLFVS